MSSISIVKTSVDSSHVAKQIAKTLVRERLCACAQVVPRVTAFYFYSNQLNSSRECWLVFKTIPAKKKNLVARLSELHPYEVPEVLTWEAESSNPDYTAWVEQNTTSKEETP